MFIFLLPLPCCVCRVSCVVCCVLCTVICVLYVLQVVNCSMPSTAKQYIHRVGRTARAGRSGRCVCVVCVCVCEREREREREKGLRRSVMYQKQYYRVGWPYNIISVAGKSSS